MTASDFEFTIIGMAAAFVIAASISIMLKIFDVDKIISIIVSVSIYLIIVGGLFLITHNLRDT